MKTKRDRLNLRAGIRREMERDELLAQPSNPERQDAAGVRRPAEPAGASLLMDLLAQEFEAQYQYVSIVALSSFLTAARPPTY